MTNHFGNWLFDQSLRGRNEKKKYYVNIFMPNNTYLCISIRYECPDRQDWESFIFCQTNIKTFRFVDSDKKHLCHKMIQINCWQEEAL